MSVSHDIRLRDVQNGQEKHKDVEKSPNGLQEVDLDLEEQGTCSRLHRSLIGCCKPCLRSKNPMPEYPSVFQRFINAFRIPPHGNIAFYIQFAVVMLQIWIVLYSLTREEALPGGNFYSLLLLFIGCAIGEYLVSFLNLPPLLGMLILGLCLRNIPGIKYVGEHIDSKWSSALRKIALAVILTRAGLGLDIVKLKKLSWAVLRLAFMPCAAEILTVGIVSHFLLGFPWLWSMLLGCILGALSPAVTVPSLVSLQDRRYGVAKGIPTMLLAAGGLDNVLCVTGFSVFMGIIFSEGDLAVTIIKGPAGVLVGIVYGFVAGIFLWYFPSKDCGNPVFYRSLMLVSSGLIAIFGSSTIGLSGAGPLGCLTTATVAAYKWRQRRQPGETDEVAGVMALTWLIMQHFLFGLIGSAVNVSDIGSQTAGLGIATLAVGLVVRSVVSSTVTMGTGFNTKERAFITLTWLAKATVQAAIGGLALVEVREMDNPDPDQLSYATDILTISVLAIIICAPTGATLMAVLGPKFLVQGDEEELEVTFQQEPHLEKEEKVAPIESTETVQVITEKDSLRGSRSSLDDNDVFRSELSMVLENRKKSISDSVGINNPAFEYDSIIKPVPTTVKPPSVSSIEAAVASAAATAAAAADSKIEVEVASQPEVTTSVEVNESQETELTAEEGQKAEVDIDQTKAEKQTTPEPQQTEENKEHQKQNEQSPLSLTSSSLSTQEQSDINQSTKPEIESSTPSDVTANSEVISGNDVTESTTNDSNETESTSQAPNEDDAEENEPEPEVKYKTVLEVTNVNKNSEKS